MISKTTTTQKHMNSQPPIYSALHFFLFWAKNWWQLKLGWCKKEDQLREILFCVWIWLTDRDRRWYTFFCFFFYLCFFLLFFSNLVVSLFFCFFLSLTVTKFMHYFNKGCFRGTLIQWWKCFLIFFVLISILLLFIDSNNFVPAGGFHIVFRANWMHGT